jgi:hypothetical protein
MNNETERDAELDQLFRRYRDACPDVEPGAQFMPVLWQKIEARQSFWSVFERLGRLIASASAVICLLLLVLNLVSSPAALNVLPTYADALVADHSAEKTYYAEAIRTNPDNDNPASQPAY